MSAASPVYLATYYLPLALVLPWRLSAASPSRLA
jgi:hypothetical protein